MNAPSSCSVTVPELVDILQLDVSAPDDLSGEDKRYRLLQAVSFFLRRVSQARSTKQYGRGDIESAGRYSPGASVDTADAH
jgi:hypothetical protein